MISLACTSPIYRIDLTRYKIPQKYYVRSVNGGVIFGKDEFDKFSKVLNPSAFQVLRCGSCVDCRLNYAHQWAVRCMLESQYHEKNIFLTLTYSDPFLPVGNFIDYNGEVKNSSLRLSDVQNFLKRLRKNLSEKYDKKIRVFYCGEYGEIGDRPHYHAIIFGFPPEAPLVFRRSSGGFTYYTSPDIEDAWSDRHGVSMGFHEISDFSYDTAAYVARYMMKKQRGQSVVEASRRELPDGYELRSNCFAHQSRMPGLAYQYFQEHKDDIYKYDTLYYQKEFKLFKSKPPRYFDKLYDIDYPDIMEAIKEDRARLGSINRGIVEFLTDEDYFARLDRESEMSARIERKRGKVL